MTTSHTNTSNSQQPAGFPPAPSEAHQRAGNESGRYLDLRAYRLNPSEEGGAESEVDSMRTAHRALAHEWLRVRHRAGYWVEGFDCETEELFVGPFNPDEAFPRYVL